MIQINNKYKNAPWQLYSAIAKGNPFAFEYLVNVTIPHFRSAISLYINNDAEKKLVLEATYHSCWIFRKDLLNFDNPLEFLADILESQMEETPISSRNDNHYFTPSELTAFKASLDLPEFLSYWPLILKELNSDELKKAKTYLISQLRKDEYKAYTMLNKAREQENAKEPEVDSKTAEYYVMAIIKIIIDIEFYRSKIRDKLK